MSEQAVLSVETQGTKGVSESMKSSLSMTNSENLYEKKQVYDKYFTRHAMGTLLKCKKMVS